MHQLIDDANLAAEIQCVSTIYDSIYFIVKADPFTIKWLNDRLIPIMVTDFMDDQTIKNTAVAEIGYDWATMAKLPNNASLKDVTRALRSLHRK